MHLAYPLYKRGRNVEEITLLIGRYKCKGPLTGSDPSRLLTVSTKEIAKVYLGSMSAKKWLNIIALEIAVHRQFRREREHMIGC